jgi:hypothetical protein
LKADIGELVKNGTINEPKINLNKLF